MFEVLHSSSGGGVSVDPSVIIVVAIGVPSVDVISAEVSV